MIPAGVACASNQATTSLAMPLVGVTCASITEKVIGLNGVSAFNAKGELGIMREWLCRLRGEVDAGLVRLDTWIKSVESSGPGQRSKDLVWVSKQS
jgi:hypothetical protein